MRTALRKSSPAPSLALLRQVERGLNFSQLEKLRAGLDLTFEELPTLLGVSRATLHRRKAERKLTPRESERVLRFSRLVDQARRIFGDMTAARQWLKFPQPALGGALPLDYARTELGAREVEDLLGRIDHGVYS